MRPVNPAVSRFLHDGRLLAMPRRWEHRKAVARWLAHATLPDLLEPVTEREITERIAALAADPVGARRAMVDLGLVHRTRDGAEYWRTELTEYDDVSGERVTVHLDGGRIDSVAALHDELDRVLQVGEGRLGSLAALDDLLRTRGGALRGAERVTIVWHDYVRSHEGLGFAATRAYLQERIGAAPAPDADSLRARLAELEAGHGKTYLELVLEVFAAHPQIDVVLR